jgi:parvulin-like peptidyl-prolyl isomerase
MFSRFASKTFIFMVALALLAGCRQNPGVTTRPEGSTGAPSTQQGGLEATLTSQPSSPTTAPTPTATPEPLALRVNDETVSLAEYQGERKLLDEALAALAKDAAEDERRQQVIDTLTDTLLLAQGAAEAGYTVDDAALQAAVDRVGAEGLSKWMAATGLGGEYFRAALRRQIAAAWQRDQIAAAVPTEAEQVHARQILTIDPNIAQRAYQYVTIPGTNFAVYAYQYDSLTGGDLGWFPRGYLTQPEVEEAAFGLQPGEISPVIESKVGYHILQVISREPARAISPDARRVLQHKAIQEWLKARREASAVEVLLP